ncbi:hypothetical protein EYB26_004837 [Talaromyces marneffei]|uniref:uncharacterized protein n=1 Tax=Talaromyces marneffei TaxID=37727 RepID=UPI0012AA1EF0|nr:uncharacterized protein EYB26_004837 [Talaromyces marneffei]QGA17167.1 hypothetical protein EYB26_004837 [Talaromyces marneffei]
MKFLSLLSSRDLPSIYKEVIDKIDRSLSQFDIDILDYKIGKPLFLLRNSNAIFQATTEGIQTIKLQPSLSDPEAKELADHIEYGGLEGCIMAIIKDIVPKKEIFIAWGYSSDSTQSLQLLKNALEQLRDAINQQVPPQSVHLFTDLFDRYIKDILKCINDLTPTGKGTIVPFTIPSIPPRRCHGDQYKFDMRMSA